MASICSASTRSSGRWSLISEYVRKPRSLPSLIRFFRRVRRVSASSLGSSAGISQASLPPRRPPRPPLPPFDLTSATLASSSSSACLALVLTGLAFLGGLVVGLRRRRLRRRRPWRAVTLARARCDLGDAAVSSPGACRRARAASARLTALAFFLAARTFFTFDLLRFCISCFPRDIGELRQLRGLGEKPKIVPKGRTFKGFDLFLPLEFQARNLPTASSSFRRPSAAAPAL